MALSRTPFWAVSDTKAERPTKKEHSFYKSCRPIAERIKIALQFSVGFGLTCLLVAKVIYSLVPSLKAPLWLRVDELRSIPTLELVAIALEYSAGIELAYTLFTEGPDEAVEPVIMGLAAAMLLGFSKLGSIDVLAGCGAIAFVLALAGLFLIRHYFVQPDNDDDEKSTNRATDNPHIKPVH
jgi:hypothetical protein